MGNDRSLNEVREDIVGIGDEILVLTAKTLREANRGAMERLHADLHKALERYKEEVK